MLFTSHSQLKGQFSSRHDTNNRWFSATVMVAEVMEISSPCNSLICYVSSLEFVPSTQNREDRQWL